MSVSYLRSLTSRMTVSEDPDPNHRVRNIHGQTDLSYSDHTLAENKSDGPKSPRETPQHPADPQVKSQTSSDTNTTNLNDNLQRLRKRIKKLSRRVIEAEKKSLSKLYDNPTKASPNVEVDAPAHLRIGFDGDQKKSAVDGNVTDAAKLKGKKRKKRKKVVEKASSSTTVQSDESNECTRIRKTDILQLIQQKEQLIHAGDESDVDTDSPNPTKDKSDAPEKSKSKFQVVSNTIAKLNNVNDHVQQVLSQSLSQKSSVVSNASTKSRSIKPVNKILTAGSAHFVTCVRSMSNTTPTSDQQPEVNKIPVTVPEYLKRTKTSSVQLNPKTPTIPKRKAKRTPKESESKLSTPKEMKSDEASIPTSKSVLKKSTTRKKPKKDRVVFNEPPEIIGQIEKTIILKSESELLKDLKPKKKRSKRKDSPQSTPSRGDSTDAEKKKTKTKSKKAKKSPDVEETPQSNSNLTEEKPKLVPVSEDATSDKQQEPAQLDSKEICRKMRKNTTHTLSNLNVQMSNTLKESIAHLNDICMRVRTTLSDMEKEQVKYNRKRRCPELSSEAGSVMEMVADASVGSVHTDGNTTSNDQSKTLYQITDLHSEPLTLPREYTVVKQLDNEGAIDHILTSISMSGDDFPTAPSQTDKETRRHRKKAKKAKKLKEQEAKEAQKETPPPVEIRQEIQERPQSYRIPIWERKPPSVINDIQMIVRRQATRSQYKEFMKTLKRETRKIKPSTIILPQESKVCLDPAWPGQVKVKPDTNHYKFAAYQKIKEIRETLAENSKNKKKCTQCSSEKCTCGITVENVHPATSAQKMQWIKTRSAMARRGIQAFDILDEITLKDLEPLQSEYPRKDHITNDDAISKVEDTLLYRLLYNESPEVLESLLRGASEDSDIKKVASPQKIEMTPSPSTVTKRDEVLRPLNLVSKAYQMYEKLELGSDPPATPPGTVRSKTIPVKALPERLKSPEVKTRKAMQTCPKQFNDAPNIPTDLYNNLNDDTKKKALRKPSTKFCNVKLRTDPEINLLKKRKKDDKKISKSSLAASSSSLSTAKKHTKQKKREYMKPKIKPYLIDPNMNLKNILTVMRVSIHPKSIPTLGGIIGRDKRFPRTPTLVVSEENRAKIAAMSKRDIIRTLKPYIFMDIKPPVLTVMPVQARYNLYQPNATRPPQEHHPVASPSRVRTNESHNRRAQNAPTKKAIYCKDHGDNSLSPLRKYCKRCLQIQHDASERPIIRKGHSEMSSTSKKGSQKPQGRPVSPKMASRRSPSKVLSEEITNNAILTRNKLNEVKTLVNNNKAYFPKDLNRAIEDIEYKIVDVLANPTRHYGDAFAEIEDEIKAILRTMGGTAGKIASVNKKPKLKAKSLRSNTNTNFEDRPSSSPLRCTSRLSINENKVVVPELRFDSCEESFGDVIQRNIAEKPLEEEKKKAAPAVGDTIKYSVSFTMDIDKAIEGLDAIMSIEPSDISDDKQSTVGNTTVSLIQTSRKPSTIGNTEVSLCGDPLPNDCTKLVTNFCEQVDRVVQKLVRNEDTQTDVSQASQETASDDQKDVDELTHRSDDYLTPYMRAVKNYRNSATSQSFVDFLDVLSNMPSSERPVTADASSETAPALMCDPLSMADDLSQETCLYDDAEFANMVDECLMCDDLMEAPSTESYYREREFRPIEECEDQLSTTPSTNIPVEIMNSPRSMFSSKEMFDTTVNTVCQTMPTLEQFNEVEDYVKQYYRNETVDETFVEDTIDRILEEEASQPSIAMRDVWTNVYPEAITPMYHGATQIPCDPSHECFTSTATADTQVTEELKDMSTDTKEIQANKNLSFNLFSASITSSEEMRTNPRSDTNARSESVSVSTQDCQMSTDKFEKSTSVDSADYLTASRCSNTPSEPIVVNEIRTDTCLLRNPEKPDPGKSAMSLDLIYAPRKTDANGDVPDLTKTTTASSQVDSNHQMMIEGDLTSNTATQRSDDNVAETTMEDEMPMMEEGGVGDYNPVARKLAPVIYQDHSKLLNSFYGLLFTIMFLGLNLTYTC